MKCARYSLAELLGPGALLAHNFEHLQYWQHERDSRDGGADEIEVRDTHGIEYRRNMRALLLSDIEAQVELDTETEVEWSESAASGGRMSQSSSNSRY